ncbi:tRNA cytosine(34) acetyltransferase TmcA, partial [Salmonella enterica]
REMPPGVATVIAPRGRGKSALAGQFISRMAGTASRLREMPPGVATVIAPRGRGKSALAGQFISRMAGTA